jgi:unsaturated chondroitin disaccharide hydrolase
MKSKKVVSSRRILLAITVANLAVHFFATATAQGQSATGCTPQALTLAEDQLTDTLAYTSTTEFPVETNPSNGNKWNLSSSSAWTSGFFPGWIWLMYENTLNSSWLTLAQAQTASLQSQDTNASTHDIGFRMLGSYGNGYRITRNPEYQQTIVTAANAMGAQLYRPIAGVIDSWPFFQSDQHITVIIDNMMNLELLFLGAQYGTNQTWYNMAVSHAVKTMENNVRPDGSTYQVVQYNYSDGTVYDKLTTQGAGTNTTWSRGQAWGIYGFTMTYRYTKDSRFLATAQKLADYFINNLPSDYVPYWDFSQSGTAPRDSSAAAIAAAGLLELSTYVSAAAQSRYRTAALNIQTSLSSPAYLGVRGQTSGILLHGSANVPAGDYDKSLIYGDYYFIEGCYRAISPPAAPTNLAATAVSPSQIDINWTAETGAVRYSVKRSTTSGGPYTIIAPPPVLTANSFSDTGLTAGATYYYVVSAAGVGGESGDSAQTFAVTPEPPAGPTITSLLPSSATAGGPGFTLTVNGTNFVSGSVVKFNGLVKTTTFVSAGQLKAAISQQDITAAGSFPVTVFISSSNQTSNAATFTVGKAGTSVSLRSSANPSTLGQSVTFTATVAVAAPSGGTPTGTVSFKNGATVLSIVTLSGGKASYTTASLALGSHAITASYAGGTDYGASTSSKLTQVVGAVTATALKASVNPTVYGQAVTLTATVSSKTAGTITGTVSFQDGTTVMGSGKVSGDKATFSTTTLSVGSHSITAVYSGNASYGPSTSAMLKHTVNKATATAKLTSSVNPSTVGESVTFKATITTVAPGTGTPTGTVTSPLARPVTRRRS